jgi:hypothetical protein
LDKAKELTIEILNWFGVYSLEIPVAEVEYNRSGSTGYWLQEIYKSKGELVDLCWLDIEYPQWRNNAHLFNWIVPYSISGKVEILKDSKVQDNNMRLFQFSNAYHYFSCAQDNQKFNKLLYEMPWLIAVGKRFQYGGLDTLVRQFLLGENRKYVAGDVTKWDKHFLLFLLNLICDIRLAVYKGGDPEYYSRMKYQYVQDLCAYMILSNGQVVQLFGSQLSGRVNTTTDNCLGHLVVIICLVLFRHYGESKYRSATMFDILQLIKGLIYADDNLLSLHSSVQFLSDFRIRSEFYQYFQWGLKKEDDMVTDVVNGQTFLGATIIEYNGFYVPQYKELRLWAGVLLQKTQLTPEQEYGKVIALYVLGAFCSRTFTDYCYNYLKHLHKVTQGHIDFTYAMQDDDLAGVQGGIRLIVAHKIPKVVEVREFFWMNLESRQAWSPADLGPNWKTISSN